LPKKHNYKYQSKPNFLVKVWYDLLNYSTIDLKDFFKPKLLSFKTNNQVRKETHLSLIRIENIEETKKLKWKIALVRIEEKFARRSNFKNKS